jgi:exodeoxyribonuclease VII large subunit
VDAHRQQVDDLSQRGGRALAHTLALRHAGLAGLQARLAALSPLATLERGYALVRKEDTGAVVRSVGQVSTGEGLTIRVADGEFDAVTRRKA